MPRPRRTGFFARLRRLLLGLLLTSVALVLCLRWLPPPTSAFMIERELGILFSGRAAPPLRHRWLPWEALPKSVAMAVVASEDQKFRRHWGFDLDSIRIAAETNTPGRLRGASTITQQVAKNLFLWPGRSWLRKGLEAYFTVLIEWLWPKQRILEVYLNLAEFGDGIYGVAAASTALFGKHPSQITGYDASLLAAVLPSPKRLRPRPPSAAVHERAIWIRRQVAQLGGPRYLDDL